jgi:hypothetical protein
MNDTNPLSDGPPAKPAKKSAKPTAKPAKAAADNRTAKIRTLVTGVKAKGFTLGAKQVVNGVPLTYAEYLRERGEAEILEVL